MDGITTITRTRFGPARAEVVRVRLQLVHHFDIQAAWTCVPYPWRPASGPYESEADLNHAAYNRVDDRQAHHFDCPAAVGLGCGRRGADIFWGGADKRRKARTLQSGEVEFAPNRRSYWVWPVVVGYLIYATVRRLMHLHAGWLNLNTAVTFGGLAVLLAIRFQGHSRRG